MTSDSQDQKNLMNERKRDPLSPAFIGALLESGIIAKIQVRRPVASFIADTKVEEVVSGILKSHSRVNEEKIRIKVEKGCVTLTGEVNKEYQRQSAKIAIRHLAGVRSVVNLISLNPGAKRSNEV
jgi:osmotically-inducible protein OsmY